MAVRNQANFHSSFLYDDIENGVETWASGNTKSITNVNVRANSVILFMWVSGCAGNWNVACSNGSFIITSSEAMSNATFKYRIL